MKKLLFAGLFGTVLFASCSKDEDIVLPEENPETIYEDGFFVLNEGAAAEGSVSFVPTDLDTAYQHVYAAANPEEELGLGKFLQSIFFHEDKAYIISNGSNVITVVDAKTFELLGKVDSGLNVPRYAAVVNGKAYVTNQASFETSEDDYIAVVDLATLEVVNTVLANGPVEYILEENGKLYIQNATYGTGNEISVFNPSTAEIEAVVQVSEGLNSIAIEDDTLYALSSTKIEKISLSTMEITELVSFPAEFTGVSNLKIEEENIYYTSADQVFAMPINAVEASTTPVIEYGSNSADGAGAMYGFEVADNKIYISDAGDFASDSYIQVYSTSGEFIEEIEVGVGPNGFYFND